MNIPITADWDAPDGKADFYVLDVLIFIGDTEVFRSRQEIAPEEIDQHAAMARGVHAFAERMAELFKEDGQS